MYDPAKPDDIRANGWMVAVHNDYTLNGTFHTFWLFTKDGRAVKGEGLTDVDALNDVRSQIQHPHHRCDECGAGGPPIGRNERVLIWVCPECCVAGQPAQR